MMRRLVLAVLALAGFVAPALAQAPPGPSVVVYGAAGNNYAPLVSIIDTCGLGSVIVGVLTVDASGTLCSSASVVNGTFDDTLTAIAALPTLAPGTQRPRGSLAGAYYVQPVFGSTAGGGTQVDSTHGLPVDVKASVLPTGAATAAAQATGNTALATINTTLGTPFQADGALGAGSAIIGSVGVDQTTPGTTNGVVVNSGTVGLSSQYPVGATALTASGTGTTGATAATLAAATDKTTYICGFSITSDATAALADAATVAGTITGTLNYLQGVGLAPAVGALNQTFAPCIPASATDTTIVVTSAAAGTGGNTAVSAWGYQL